MAVTYPNESAPISIVATPGTVVNISEYLRKIFDGGFYEHYWFYNDNSYDAARGFWGNSSTQASYFTVNGIPQSEGFFNVLNGNLNSVNLVVGNEICNRLLVQVNTGNGPNLGDQTWSQFWIKVIPAVYIDPTPWVVDASDVVAAARAFGQHYAGTFTPDGCHDLALSFAAAAGAPLPMESGSIVPSENRNGGLWSVVHRGDSKFVANWQSLLLPGDIVRYDYSDPSQPFHTFTVLSVSGNKVETIDNFGGYLNFHFTNFEKFVNPATVTIYRITEKANLLEGSGGSDRLFGSILDDRLVGLTGSDYLSGGRGNDILISGGGADTLVGGAGFDTADYSASISGVAVDLSTGSGSGGDALGDSLASIERIVGSNLSDILSGDAGDNALEGQFGNDLFVGRAGADTLVGGEGFDTSVYSGARSDYTVQKTATTLVVADLTANRDGTDTLFGVEKVAFSNGALIFDQQSIPMALAGVLKNPAYQPMESATLVYRLYAAAYARTPDEGGLVYWSNRVLAGDVNAEILAQQFRLAPEFVQKYGSNLDDRGYTDKLYSNVLGRPSDQGGLDFWTSHLTQNFYNRDQLMAVFAVSPENIERTTPDVANGYWVL